MIGHDTALRDWIATVADSRSRAAVRGAPRIPPRTDELKRRLDDLEQRNQLRELIGTDPY